MRRTSDSTKMTSWAVYYAAPVFLNIITIALSQQLQLPPIYWNLTGNTFSTAQSLVVTAPISSAVDVLCPFYSGSANAANYEYYQIYRVTQASYAACNLYQSTDSTTPQLLVNCSSPTTQRTATIAFLRYSSIPGSIDFQPGLTYYYISTSSGTLSGLAQSSSGVCSANNMRIAFYVTNSSAVSATTTVASTATTLNLFGASPAPLKSSTNRVLAVGSSASARHLLLTAIAVATATLCCFFFNHR